MKKNPLIWSILTLILLLPIVIAISDPETYTEVGADRQGLYAQGGTGVWSGEEGLTYQRSYTFMISTHPIIDDVDKDGDNEIIILADTRINILNYTYGVGIIEEASVTYGSGALGTVQFNPNPTIYDVDGDGYKDIISYNGTHMLRTEYNGTAYVQTSVLIGLNLTPYSTGYDIIINPSIKCVPSVSTTNNAVLCFTKLQNLSGTNLNLLLGVYDPVNNNVTVTTVVTGGQNEPPLSGGLTIVNGDLTDSYDEIYIASLDVDRYLHVAKMTTGQNQPAPQLFQHDAGDSVNNQWSDIIVNNLDGNPTDGLEISFGFTDDGTNYDMLTYSAFDGSLVDGGYCIIGCPEGSDMYSNPFEPIGSTYNTYTNDVCIYIRNPSTNVDSIYCVNLYGGIFGTDQAVITEVTNSNYNISGYSVIHSANLFPIEGLLLNNYMISSDELSTTLTLNDGVNIPVDYQRSGSLDIIGISSNTLYYYDDDYINANYVIESLTGDSSPLCQSYTYTFDLELSDAENDDGNCYVEELNQNLSSKSNFSNTSITSPSVGYNAYYFADELGTYFLNFNCKDQYHDSFTTLTRTFTVSNDTSICHLPGTSTTTEEVVIDDEALQEEDFADNVDSALSDVGLVSNTAKAIFWLVIMIFIGFLIVKETENAFILALLETVMLVIGWYFGFIGAISLVIIGMVAAAVITLALVGRKTQA